MVVASAIAERTIVETVLPALEFQFLGAVGEIVGGIARADQFVPAVGAGSSGNV